MKLGVLTGLQFEAQLIHHIFENSKSPIIRCSGANKSSAKGAAQELINMGCDRLLSFGVAGGLSSDLKIGELVIGTSVIRESDGAVFQVDPNWCNAIHSQLSSNLHVSKKKCVGVNEPVSLVSKKNQLAEQFDASFVDMESHILASAATTAGLPFAVLRAVSDTGDMPIPRWVFDGIKENGTIDYVTLIWHGFSHIGDWPHLLKLQYGKYRACSQLKKAIHYLEISLMV